MVDTDPQVILCLIAIRFLGGKSVPAGIDLFKKGLQVPLKYAAEQGWVLQHKVKLATTSKTGKQSMKSTDVLDLTPQGEAVLRQTANADDMAAATAAQQLAGLRAGLEADRQTLRQEVLNAVATKTKKTGPSPEAEMVKLNKAVSALAAKLQTLEDALHAVPENAVLTKIDEAFDRLLAKVQAAPRGPSSVPPITGMAPLPPLPKDDSLRPVLRQAYEKLCRFIEFESGLVDLPRLYHEARVLQPTLSLDNFHRELDSLASQRVLELRVLNEVRTAVEPEKAIRRGDNLYYFVYWKQP
jgi:hypothetical protein